MVRFSPRIGVDCVYVAIQVSRELEAEVESRVKKGRYQSAEQLLREALELVDERDEIREAVAQGIGSRAGRVPGR